MSNKCMQWDNYSSHQAGHLRKYSKRTQEKIFVSASVSMHPHQPNKFNQYDSAYSQAKSFEKTFETNSRENVDKLQKLKYAQVNQMIQKAIDHVCELDESAYLNELDDFCELVELNKLDELDVLGKLDELVELGELGKSIRYLIFQFFWNFGTGIFWNGGFSHQI